MAGILDAVSAQVDQMSEEELRAEFLQYQKAKAEQKERQQKYNATPEAKANRKAYQEKRLADINADPEKKAALTASRKAYHEKPEVKARMKEYRDKRNAKIKAVMARAKQLGINLEDVGGDAANA